MNGLCSETLLEDPTCLIIKPALLIPGQIYPMYCQAWKRNVLKSSIPNKKEEGGCYIATCVYGSYDCPEVWTLRRFRDYKLASSWLGRSFIHTYYVISPTIVRWFGKTKWFNHFWKGKLDRMANHLQKKGYQDTPYYDR